MPFVPREPLLAHLLFCGIFLACSNEGDESASGGDGDGAEESTGGGSGGLSVEGEGDTAGEGDGGAEGDGDGDQTPTNELPPDCEDLAICGPGGATDCCERVEITGGTFLMGRGDDDACPAGQTCAPHETPENDVVVDSFFLDAFEVTVGRFRRFVEAYDDFSVNPADGANPLITGSGWHEDFDALLPRDEQALRTALDCDEASPWTDAPGAGEALPISCVNWGVAFAFCTSVGGRLPTEAEWEYAAAGGDENRLYPWGDAEPNDERASYYPGQLVVAGALADGRGRFGTFDQAGNVWEWVLDWLDTGWYEDEGTMCENCARVSSGTHRVLRGGAYSYEAVTLRAATRSGELPEMRAPSIGFRCAYSAR